MKKMTQRIFDLYASLPWLRRLQIRQRWLGAPYELGERFVPRQGEILDLGCGYGIFANMLALKSDKRDVWGIDFSPERILEAQKTIAKRRNIHFLVANVRDYRLPKCQGIIFYDVLHHLDFEEHAALLSRCFGALAQNGILLVMETGKKPLWKYLVWRLFEWVAFTFRITPGESLSFRVETDWLSLFQKAGFRVRRYYPSLGRPFPHVLFVGRKE